MLKGPSLVSTYLDLQGTQVDELRPKIKRILAILLGILEVQVFTTGLKSLLIVSLAGLV